MKRLSITHARGARWFTRLTIFMWNELRNDFAVKMHFDWNTIWFRLKTITLCCEETSWLANSQKWQGTILQWEETLINRHRQPLSKLEQATPDLLVGNRTLNLKSCENEARLYKNELRESVISSWRMSVFTCLRVFAFFKSTEKVKKFWRRICQNYHNLGNSCANWPVNVRYWNNS